jgi:demethylmenaquinone methyltransferase / 2-methoxy-6-polyprenyl-1,4-benzoquinol methylase
MTSEMFYGRTKATYVQERFSAIADRYDLFNDLITGGLHRYWKSYVIKQTGLKRGDRALDLCCGTGDITHRLGTVVEGGGLVIGLDFSPGMLRVAGTRINPNNTVLLQSDATILPVKSDSLDAVTVGFGLRNLADIDRCLREAWRVLKPGGCFVSLDMGKVTQALLRRLFHWYFFRVVPTIGRLIIPGETLFDYFPRSSITYPSPEALADRLRDTGFIVIEITRFFAGSTVVHQARKPDPFSGNNRTDIA